MFGTTLIIIGSFFLLKNLGLISGSLWNIVWPSLIIILGLKSVLRKKYSYFDKFHRFKKEAHKFNEGMRRGEE